MASRDLGRGFKGPPPHRRAFLDEFEIARSVCDVVEPGVNVLSLPHADLHWINFLGGVRDVTVPPNTDVMVVKMRNCRGGVITIDMKDIPIGAYGLDDVMLPRYSPLFSRPCPDLLPSSQALLFRLLYLKRRGAFSFTRPWKISPAPNVVACYNTFENLVSLAVPLSFALLPMPVIILSSSSFMMMRLRLKRVSITTDIPADEVHEEQLRRITKFVEARRDAGFTLSPVWMSISRLLRLFSTRRRRITPSLGIHWSGRLRSLCGFEGRRWSFPV